MGWPPCMPWARSREWLRLRRGMEGWPGSLACLSRRGAGVRERPPFDLSEDREESRESDCSEVPLEDLEEADADLPGSSSSEEGSISGRWLSSSFEIRTRELLRFLLLRLSPLSGLAPGQTKGAADGCCRSWTRWATLGSSTSHSPHHGGVASRRIRSA